MSSLFLQPTAVMQSIETSPAGRTPQHSLQWSAEEEEWESQQRVDSAVGENVTE